MDPFRGSASPFPRNQLRGPAFHRHYQDVYIDSSVTVDHRDWCRAAALLLPSGGAVGLLSAAHLLGLRGLGPGPDVRVLIPPAASLRPHTNLVVRRAQLADSDIVTLFGIPLTTPARTAFDLARFLPEVDAVVALDPMLRQAKVPRAALASYTESHAWWPRIAAVRTAFSLADGLAESPQETRMRLHIGLAGAAVQRG